MNCDAEAVKTADPMTEEGRLRQQVQELRGIRAQLEAALKKAKDDVERARELHGKASDVAYRLGQENDAMIVTIRVLSKELEQWKR